MKRFILALAAVFWTGMGIFACAEAANTDLALIPFRGSVDLQGEKVALVFGDGAGVLSVDLIRSSGGRYDLTADIRHLQVSGWDMAAVLNGRFELEGPSWSAKELLGDISVQYILLNYKPVRDAKIRFAVRERRLIVDEFWFGALAGKGSIGLMDPYEMSVDLELVSADLEGAWEVLRARGITPPPVSGVIQGAVGLKGPLIRPQLSGWFSAYKGRFKDFGYERIDLRFQGAYPLIRLEDARVTAQDGPSFKLNGALELDDMAGLPVQLGQLKRDFIVSDSDGGRTWALRLNGSADSGSSTQIKSFVSGNADGRGEGDGVIGLQKHIGF